MEKQKGSFAAYFSAISLGIAMFFGLSSFQAKALPSPQPQARPEELSPQALQTRGDMLVFSDRKSRAAARRRELLLKAGAGSVFSGVIMVLIALKAGLVRAIKTFGALMGGSLGGILGFLGDLALSFILIAALMAVFFRLLYPEKSFKQLFTLKNTGLMFLAALGVNLIGELCAALSPKAYALSEIIRCTSGSCLLLWVYKKIILSIPENGVKALKVTKKAAVRTILGITAGNMLFAALKIALRFMGKSAYAFFAGAGGMIIIALYGAYRLRKPKKAVLVLNDNGITEEI
ncbi:MAG: hypothetical protein GX061_08540 [Eubacteriaceae bacterium]|nr:hypothetical protein [Eubacteriaceae bacterium]